ncbi:MAG: hypothetical protein JXA44_01080 [Methanospirillaceae archaeon]|nr:hypothetical protein [Methanospirillaceae archaeon]
MMKESLSVPESGEEDTTGPGAIPDVPDRDPGPLPDTGNISSVSRKTPDSPEQGDDIVQITKDLKALTTVSGELKNDLKKTLIFISKWYRKNQEQYEPISESLTTLTADLASLTIRSAEIHQMIEDLGRTVSLHTSSIASSQDALTEKLSGCHKDIESMKKELTFIFYLMGIGFVLLFIVSLMK